MSPHNEGEEEHLASTELKELTRQVLDQRHDALDLFFKMQQIGHSRAITEKMKGRA